MRRQQIFLTTLAIMVAGVFAFAFSSQDSSAQGSNLLNNPGFEGGYFLQDNIVEIAVPNGWRMHWLDSVRFEGSEGPALRPETVVWNINDAPLHERPVFWRDGTYNVKIFKGGAPVYGGMSQDLTLERGATYRFTVPVFVDVVGEYTPSGKNPPSNPLAGGVRLGAGQTGAGFRDANNIAYSPWFNGQNTPGFFLNMNDYTYEFVAPSDQTTVWFEVFGSEARPNNGFFIDGLSLVKIKAATPPTPTPVPPTPTPIATATPVRPTATPLPVGPWFTPTPVKIWPTKVPTVVKVWPTKTPVWPTKTPVPIVPTAAPVVISVDNAQVVQPVQAVAVISAPQTEIENGVIYAIVGSNDSVWSIAAKNSLTLDQILDLNDYPEGSNPFVSFGDRLIVGYDESEPEPEPEVVVEEDSGAEANADGNEEAATDSEVAATEEESADSAETASEDAAASEPVVVTPDPSPTPSGAEICLSAYDDDNSNAIYDVGEALRTDVAFTILNGDRVVSNYITTGREPFCITGLDAGAYRVTRSKMDDEELTSGGERTVTVTNGESVEVLFGSIIVEPAAEVAVVNEAAETASEEAAVEAEQAAVVEAEEGSNNSEINPTSGILIAVVIAAILLLVALLVIIMSRRNSSS
ncbi:MAG: LysM peptidoglycan-binding domain-containing protein [Candidatus Promineifilaceae bacterium]